MSTTEQAGHGDAELSRTILEAAYAAVQGQELAREAVEAGAQVLYDLDGEGIEDSDNIGWAREGEPVRNEYRRKARAVLTAALGVTVEAGESRSNSL